MAFIKLTEPGSAHTMTITKVVEDKSGSWPDWKFSDAKGDVLTVPQKALERQLARLEVDTAFDLVGSTVKFSRSEKAGANGKYFWNADLAAARDAVPAPPSKRIPPPGTNTPQSGGAHIPDMDDDPGPQDPDEPLYREPAPSPREQREKVAGVSERETAYLACWDRVARHLAKTCSDLEVPLDASAIQATTFSIFGGQR